MISQLNICKKLVNLRFQFLDVLLKRSLDDISLIICLYGLLTSLKLYDNSALISVTTSINITIKVREELKGFRKY